MKQPEMKSFYQVWTEARRIRKAMGFGDANDSMKVLKELAVIWVRNPELQ